MAKPKIGTGKDVKKIIAIAKGQKWMVNMTPGNHIRFVPPSKDKPIVIYSLSSSDHRSFQNLKSQLRRSGLNIGH